MKRLKITLAIVLLFALLLSGCGQTVPQFTRETGAAPETHAAPAALQTLSAYRGAPSGFALPRAAAGNVTPTTVKSTMFGAKFEGKNVSGRGEAVDGVYHFVATQTDGEAWHVKLECNYPTVAGRDYRVTYRFHSDVAGRVKFGDFQEFDIHQGENAVTGMLTATGGTSYLDLQLGMLPPFMIDFSEIEVEEYADAVEYENALPTPVNFEKESVVWEKHDQGYAPVLTRSSDGVSIEYLATSWDAGVWKSRLYIKTGLVPASGVHYHVTADVTCDGDMPFEVLFNNGDEEKGYGALYGQKIDAGRTTTCEAVINGTSDGDNLVMQFSLGEVPEGSTVKIGNLHVETIKDHYTSVLPALFALDTSVETGRIMHNAIPTSYKEVPVNISYSGTDTVYEAHDDGYVVKLEESASSATLKITKAPESDRRVFKVKLYAATGVTLEAGTTYQISYDLASTGDQAKYEVLFSGNAEESYGADKNRSLTAGGTDHVEYTVTPDASRGPLTLLFQLGQTDTTAGNTVTLSNLNIEKITAEYQEIALSDNITSGFWAEKAYTGAGGAVVTKDGGSASMEIKGPPASGRESWKAKFFVNEIAALTAGKEYKVSVDVVSTKEFDYEICYNDTVNGGGEKAFGAEYGLPAAAVTKTVTHVVKPSADANLSLQFNLGNIPEPGTFTVSNIQVKEVTRTEDTAVAMSGFAYPTTSGGETIPAAYVPQTVSISASYVAWDGSQATASYNDSSATLDVTQARDPDKGGIWVTRLETNTGVTLEKGEKYRVGGTITSEKAIERIEVLYSNGIGTNEDGNNPGGQGYSDTVSSLTVAEDGGSANFTAEFTVPNRSEYRPLYLRIQAGNGPAPNKITVSNISVEKYVPGQQTGGETAPGSFHTVPENDAANKATLSGNGSSATATINASELAEAWKIKLYADTHAQLEKDHKYRIDMKVTSDGSGWNVDNVDYKRTGDEYENDYNSDDTTSGETISHTVTAKETGNLEIVLKIGKVEVGKTVTVSDISVTELGSESEGDNIAPETIADAGYWLDDAYNTVGAGEITASGSTTELELYAPPADARQPWKVKLFINEIASLTAGKQYRVSADVTSTEEFGYELCCNDEPNGGGEKNLGFKGGLQAGPSAQTISCDVKADADAMLSLQFNLGNIPAAGTVTVSNLKVEEMGESEGESVLPSFSYDSVGYISRAADEGYVTLLEQGSSSATFHILKAPSSGREVYKVKLNVRTGFTPEKSKGYRVSFDLKSAKSQNAFEVFYDGNKESAYGATSTSLPAGKKTVSYTIMPGESKGELVLQLRCGKTNGTDGNTYTFSNLKIEEVTFRYTDTPEVKAVTTLVTQNGYEEQLEKTRDKATVRIEKTPASGREAWKSKLFVETGVTLRPEQKYRISMDVKSIIPAPFEVCFNNGGVEKGLGAIFGLISTPAGQHVEYITYAKEDTQLVIQLSLGNCSAPNSIMLSNVKVEKAGTIELVSDTIYTF